MKIKTFIFCLFLLLNKNTNSQSPEKDFYFMFYNVENLFDPFDAPASEDEEFTPKGARRWTYKRFNKKLINTSKVILNAAGWTPPHLIVVCEVENRFVLEKLLKDTPLEAYPYNIIHKESPDARGIDVALLYNTDAFYPLEYRYYPLQGTSGEVIKSRELLYVCGILNERDTLHIFGNHWPSRYSGLLESQSGRQIAAQTLRACIDQVQRNHKNPKIIVAGDFNDQPTDKSIAFYLKALEPEEFPDQQKLYNLSLAWLNEEIQTLKYQMQWSVFDQIIVSGSFIEPEKGCYTKPEWATIVKLPFLLEKDERYGGKRLFRTYYGYKYQGGYSDHLPVLLQISQPL